MFWAILGLLVFLGVFGLLFAQRNKKRQTQWAQLRRDVAKRSSELRAEHAERARRLGKKLREGGDILADLREVQAMTQEGILHDERAALAMLDEVIGESAVLVNGTLAHLEMAGGSESILILKDLAQRNDITPSTKRALMKTIKTIYRRVGGQLSVGSTRQKGQLQLSKHHIENGGIDPDL